MYKKADSGLIVVAASSGLCLFGAEMMDLKGWGWWTCLIEARQWFGPSKPAFSQHTACGMPDQSNTEHACALLLNGPFGIVQLVLVFNCRWLTGDLCLYVYMHTPVRKEAQSICTWNWTTSTYSPYKQRALVFDHMLPFREKNRLLPLHVSHPNLWHLFFIRVFSPALPLCFLG